MSETLQDRSVRFDAFRIRHRELTSALNARNRVIDGELRRQIEAFRADLRAAGHDISDESERLRAEAMLDQWLTELLKASPADAKVLVLEPFRPERQDADADAVADRPAARRAVAPQREEQDRQVIRMIAAARLWKESCRADGYLLSGEALEEARKLGGRDPAIDELIAASDRLAQRRQRDRKLAVSLIVAVVLAALSAAWMRERHARHLESEKRGVAEARANKEAQNRVDLEEEYKAKLERAGRAALDAQADVSALVPALQVAALSCQIDLTTLDVRLQVAALGLSPDEVRANAAAIRTVFGRCARPPASRVQPAELPAIARRSIIVGATVASSSAPESSARQPEGPELFAGYRRDFLTGVPLDPPALQPTTRERAWEAGRAVPYYNFSVVLSRARRMAIYSASNVDRAQLRPSDRGREMLAFDPRIPADVQPDRTWFAGIEPDRGHLVTPREVAWGPALSEADPGEAWRLVASVDYLPNIAPLSAALAQGTWRELESWVLTLHNPAATRLSIFSGPFLREDDPVANGVRMPQAYWKVAVSQTAKSGLVAEAFRVLNTREGAGKFVPDNFRIPIRDVEEQAGLDFGAAVRAADAYQPDLARLSGSIVRTTAPLNRAIEQALAQGTKSSIAASAAKTSITKALPTPPRNGPCEELKSVLMTVTAGSSTGPLDVESAANERRLVATARKGSPTVPCEVSAETASALAILEARSGIRDRPTQTVYFQFSGFRRQDAVAISSALREVGWSVPGEERTEKAEGKNEVRYGSAADRKNAERLVADIRAAGHAGLCCAVVNPAIKAGILEVWISR